MIVKATNHVTENVETSEGKSEQNINIDKETMCNGGRSINNNKVLVTYLGEGEIKYHCNVHLKAVKQMRHHQTCRVSDNVATIACACGYSVEVLAQESERKINS